MYCENCGKRIEDGAKFCRYCGTRVDATEILADAMERVEAVGTVGETKTAAAAVAAGILEAGGKYKKRKSKKGFIIAVAAVLSTLFAVLIGISIYNKPANRLARALDLGQRYLLEENYEQAIVEFGRAIEIDPKNEEAYIGLAEAYVETDDLEKAVRVLEKGAEKIDSEELQEMLEKYAVELTEEELPDAVAETGEDSAAEASEASAAEEPEGPEAPAQEERAMEPEEPAAPAEEQTMENESAGVRTERYDYDGGYCCIDTYDGNGNIIKEEWYNGNGSLIEYLLYTYDGNGNIIKEEWYNGNGSLKKTCFAHMMATEIL